MKAKKAAPILPAAITQTPKKPLSLLKNPAAIPGSPQPKVRLNATPFGILMSLEPAVAALCGAVFLGQGVRGLELLAIALVIVASVGASLRVVEAPPPEV